MTTAAICLGIYAVICVAGAVGLERARRALPPTPEYVRWLPLLPPVPPSRHYADDLLADFPQPLNKWLTPELTDRMFDELIALEGLQ